MTRNHRSTVIIDKAYKAFFHCNDYLHWAHRPDQVFHSTFILAPEVEFKLALHQHNEGYDTDNISDLPQLLKRMAHIHVATTTNEDSINPSGFQGGAAPTSPPTLTRKAAESLFHRLAQKCLNFNDIPPTVMECGDEDRMEGYLSTAPLDDEVWF